MNFEKITIETDAKIESMNKFHNRRGRGAQFFYSRYRDGWFTEIMAHLPAGSHDSHDEKRHLVKITSIRRQFCDVGNLYGGAKPILDALVRYGIIKDDSPKWCEEKVEQFTIKPSEGPTKTIIEITKISDAN